MSPRGSLRARRDFERVRTEGTRVSGPRLRVWVAPQPDPAGPSRLGLAVGAGIGPAVVRNRARRRLRAAWRSVSPPPGLDMVASAGRGIESVSFQKLTATFARAAEAER
ncbi:MAG TPA: ribonuclease P protein component [Actinomycetota bacterium]|nr:ribonuclease P protein component [Actinomycetota bacterium]